MQLQKAERKRAKIKMGIQGPSGSGKTYSALLLAFGLCNDWTKIAVVDSENKSANLYAHLGNYNVVNLQAPFTPERYIEAIQLCEKASMEVIIVDSISHEWDGIGGLLETHGNMMGNSYTNWNKITPRHNSFIQHLLQSPAHIIAIIRAKQDYILSEKNGKMVPEKVGLRGISRDGTDYEFTLVFELDIKHNCHTTKDRTSVFMDRPDFIITKETGKNILDWCNDPVEETSNFDYQIINRVNSCKSLEELLSLYKDYPQYQKTMLPHFTKKRQLLTVKNDLQNIINDQNIINNGTTNI